MERLGCGWLFCGGSHSLDGALQCVSLGELHLTLACLRRTLRSTRKRTCDCPKAGALASTVPRPCTWGQTAAAPCSCLLEVRLRDLISIYPLAFGWPGPEQNFFSFSKSSITLACHPMGKKCVFSSAFLNEPQCHLQRRQLDPWWRAWAAGNKKEKIKQEMKTKGLRRSTETSLPPRIHATTLPGPPRHPNK